jgi:hypothetical protein
MYIEARSDYRLLLSLYSHSVIVVNLKIRSQVKWDYPLNLSILLRGGQDTNQDALSNGE